MINEIDILCIKILFSISKKTKSSSELAEDLSCSQSSIKRKYNILYDYKLIETKTGKGAKLTKRGINLIRLLRDKDSIIVS